MRRSVSASSGVVATSLLLLAAIDAVVYLRGILAGESYPDGPIGFGGLLAVWFGSVVAAAISAGTSDSGEAGRSRRRWLLVSELVGAPLILFGAYIAGLSVMQPGS